MARTKQTYRITQRWVDALKAPDPSGEQKRYFDSTLPGFGVQVSATAAHKLYFVQKAIMVREWPSATNSIKRMKTIYRPIGPAAALRCDRARELAGEMLLMMAKDIDPDPRNITDKIVDDGGMTLRQAFDKYTQSREGKGRAETRRVYALTPNTYLKDWADKPLRDITRSMVWDRFYKITKDYGKATANQVFIHFRAFWSMAARNIENMPLPACPTIAIEDSWHNIAPRTRFLSNEEIPVFWNAIGKLENPVVTNFFKLVLFTGMRKMEAAGLRWEEVDLEKGLITLPPHRHKNGESGKVPRPFILPMSNEVRAILLEGQALMLDRIHRKVGHNRGITQDNFFVFPGARQHTHFTDTGRHLKTIKKICGIGISTHDLRRTFTTASTNAGVHPFRQDALTNHLSQGMTARYDQAEINVLRVEAQKVSTLMFKLIFGTENELVSAAG